MLEIFFYDRHFRQFLEDVVMVTYDNKYFSTPEGREGWRFGREANNQRYYSLMPVKSIFPLKTQVSSSIS